MAVAATSIRPAPALPDLPGRLVVLNTDVASRAFRSLLPQMVARLTGLQPPPTFVNTRGTPIQWTILRHTGHGNSDTRVAARCVACCPPLATLNVKDFTDFAEHDETAHDPGLTHSLRSCQGG